MRHQGGNSLHAVLGFVEKVDMDILFNLDRLSNHRILDAKQRGTVNCGLDST